MTDSSLTQTHDPQGPFAALPTPNSRPGLGREAKLAFAALTLFVIAAMAWPHREDNTAPGGEVLDARGRGIQIESVMAPVTLVHFWSTWCPPCITETPSIQRLAADYSSSRDFGLVMVAVAEDVQKAEDFLGTNSSLFDPDWKIAKRYGTDKLPETHLVVRGQMVESFIGATDWDSPEVRARIDEALAAARAPETEDA